VVVVYNRVMAKHVFHISDTEAASDFAALLARKSSSSTTRSL